MTKPESQISNRFPRETIRAWLRERLLPFVFVCCLTPILAPACRAPEPPQPDGSGTAVYRDEVRFGLPFEERMSVAAELSRLKADAARRADEVYAPFRSRENAVRNEEMAARLLAESKAALMKERNLTQEQLNEIVREYQTSLGANIR